MKKTTATTVVQYNRLQTKNAREVCAALQAHLDRNLKDSESKIWHGSPVWFIDGNPVVAYSVRKDGRVALMFFSGQSFDEPGLTPEGKFRAAEVFYTNAQEIKVTHLKRWIKKSRTIQWDYKNIMKNKGLVKVVG